MEATIQSDFLVEVLLLGDKGVGKSSLLHWWERGEFGDKIIGTAGMAQKTKNI